MLACFSNAERYLNERIRKFTFPRREPLKPRFRFELHLKFSSQLFEVKKNPAYYY